jgi:hypothetical protein
VVEKLILLALRGADATDSPPVYATAAENRIYALVLPDNTTKPAVVFQRITNNPINNLSGHSGVDNPRIQVDSYAAT